MRASQTLEGARTAPSCLFASHAYLAKCCRRPTLASERKQPLEAATHGQRNHRIVDLICSSWLGQPPALALHQCPNELPPSSPLLRHTCMIVTRAVATLTGAARAEDNLEARGACWETLFMS